jgi:carbonic anhydrase
VKNISVVLSALMVTLLGSGNLPTCAQQTLTPPQAYKAVQDGNARYLTGASKHTRIDVERRVETATYGQKPIAAILGCADSRVPPEIVLDQGFADLFVVRVAGNVSGPMELASLEYAVSVLNTPLIVVLGHTACGAVSTAMTGKPPFPGSLGALMDQLAPAVQHAKSTLGPKKNDAVARAVDDNVLHTMEEVLKSPVIKPAVAGKKVMIVGGVRDLKTGKIRWFGEHPSQSKLLAGK